MATTDSISVTCVDETILVPKIVPEKKMAEEPFLKCGTSRDLIPSVQFKKREKHPWRSVDFKASACNFTKINTPPWMFFTFFKLYKLYQIGQRIT